MTEEANELPPTAIQKRPTLRSPVFRVRVVTPPTSPSAVVGKEVTIDSSTPQRIYIGSSDVSELRVEGDRLVSRRHAALEMRGDRLVVRDLESTNGTSVNGVQVTEALLAGGERLRVGETDLAVELVTPSTSVTISPDIAFGRLLGGSPQMRRLYPLCERLARSDVPLIIEGETGTGKEVLAEAIHEASGRKSGPFVVFDCTTVPPTLVESAIFGHERGAFTGATNAKAGVFEQANGGTLLIDEIGDLDISLQPKLLRAIERASVQRVGATHWTKVDVRVIAATRRNLESAIQAGRFRDDLYYRLAVARIEIPPLRERTGDVRLLAEQMWTRAGGDGVIPERFVESLESYGWPGNVRELQNAIAHRAALGDLADLATIQRARVPSSPSPSEKVAPASSNEDVIGRVIAEAMPYARARQVVLRRFEERYLTWVLDKHGGNVSKAAEASGIARRYFYVLRNKEGDAEGDD